MSNVLLGRLFNENHLKNKIQNRYKPPTKEFTVIQFQADRPTTNQIVLSAALPVVLNLQVCSTAALPVVLTGLQVCNTKALQLTQAPVCSLSECFPATPAAW